MLSNCVGVTTVRVDFRGLCKSTELSKVIGLKDISVILDVEILVHPFYNQLGEKWVFEN